MTTRQLAPDDVSFLIGLVQRHSGILLPPEKAYLFESRLLPVASRFGCADLRCLLDRLRTRPGADLLDATIDAMTINETSFFRDSRPFDQFRRQILPKLVERRAPVRRLRLWSAAASTGQEAYSLAMCIEEARERMRGWQVEILASDISSSAIAKAREGSYSQFEVQRGVPAPLLVRHFTQNGKQWQVKPELKKYVRFFQHNLLSPPRFPGSVDVVFLRNVLIYMDEPTRRRIVEHILSRLASDGYLFVGSTESLTGLVQGLAPVPGSHAVYQPAAAATAPAAPGTSRPAAAGSAAAGIRPGLSSAAVGSS